VYSCYKEYLLYLFGELTEYHSETFPDSRYWKNDEYCVVLEFKTWGDLWIHYNIWDNFSMFFSLDYIETQQLMKSLLEEHLKLRVITPLSGTYIHLYGLEEHLKSGGITPHRF
jgi:hypothetical protein